MEEARARTSASQATAWVFREAKAGCFRVADFEAPDVPVPEKGWPAAGCLMGDGFSIAWRVFDAQFWGTPQRRRRIALVADFGGRCAPEVLFERKSVSGDSEPGRAEGKTAAGAAAEGSGAAGNDALREASVCFSGISYSKYKKSDNTSPLVHVPMIGGYNNNIIVSNGTDKAGTLDASYYKGTGARSGNERTFVAIDAKTYSLQRSDEYKQNDVSSTQSRRQYKAPTDLVVEDSYIVRRLTPLECERLQGYPDGWTNIGDWTDSRGKIHKGGSDAPRYKALGNSICLPSWRWVLSRLIACCSEKTMASLFDGIGGFPLIWNSLGGKTLWNSEIEEFACAVTERRFP